MGRVEIPAYADRWMRGDRYGEIVAIRTLKSGEHAGREAFTVLLDRSGAYRTYPADDCRPI